MRKKNLIIRQSVFFVHVCKFLHVKRLLILPTTYYIAQRDDFAIDTRIIYPPRVFHAERRRRPKTQNHFDVIKMTTEILFLLRKRAAPFSFVSFF